MFTLEYPYTQDWAKGYLVHNGDRRTVILYNNPKDRSSTSYARYIMSVHLGRYLEDSEHVDHIDNDKSNDTIENLQLLSQLENSTKEGKRRGRLMVKLICPCCGNKFTRRRGNTHLEPSQVKIVTTCSRSCSGKISFLSEENRKILAEKSVVEIYRQH